MVCFSLRLSRRSCKVRVARVDPIPFHVKNDATGLGKTSQDFRMIETTVSQRRELDSERQRNETEEQRKAREVSVTGPSFILLVTYYPTSQGDVARRAALQTQISEVLRPFYCTVCDKQFQNVAQYDEHTNSYAHHHKIRFRDMQSTQRAKQNTPEEQDRRKEKERKREEKELRKIAAAAGVRMAKSMPNAPTLDPVSASGESKSPGFKKGGWASIPPTTADSTSRATGRSAVGSSADSSHSPSPAPDAVLSSSGFSTTHATLYPRDPPDQRQLHQPPPAFRTAGWSSIDGTTQPPPPPPPLPFRDVPAMTVTNVHHLPDQGPSTTPPTSSIPASGVPGPGAVIAAPEALAPRSFKSKKEKESAIRENARSGWQSFQKGGRRK
jgi:hypothetical protein